MPSVGPLPDWCIHSDRGIQYAAAEYASLLAQHGMTASMSRRHTPMTMPSASFIKTLKQEEIYCHRYRDREDLRGHLREFLEEYYNRCRLHSALGYRTPAEFEAAASKASKTSLAASVTLSFPGMGKSISPMNETILADNSRLSTRKAGAADPPAPSDR